jgi:hypothetical protein
MLRGHGTLKYILGRSVIPAKRRRAGEDGDDAADSVSHSTAPPAGSKQPEPPQGAPVTPAKPLDRLQEAAAVKPGCCPICGKRFVADELPDVHVGAAPAHEPVPSFLPRASGPRLSVSSTLCST